MIAIYVNNSQPYYLASAAHLVLYCNARALSLTEVSVILNIYAYLRDKYSHIYLLIESSTIASAMTQQSINYACKCCRPTVKSIVNTWSCKS